MIGEQVRNCSMRLVINVKARLVFLCYQIVVAYRTYSSHFVIYFILTRAFFFLKFSATYAYNFLLLSSLPSANLGPSLCP